MNFTKMHGLGNDFVLVCQVQAPSQTEMSTLARKMCDRHLGVGADGLVAVYPSASADVAMRIFNSDGTLAEQCGNAMRCVARYYYERISSEKTEFAIETKVGVQPVWIIEERGKVKQVRVDMGKPVLVPKQIPVLAAGELAVNKVIRANDKTFRFSAVSMGNPHAVIEVNEAEKFPVDVWGPLLESHEIFPQKANIEFVTYHSPQEVTMRVWERGVGQTMACGSGACATVVAGFLSGRCGRKVLVHLPGGDLMVEWDEQDQHVYMTGPAEFVFDGAWLS
ncbi:diaminopimelate epimerase [Thermoactinomyces mirandus]|uniref:Diaminopimelate epimerase n=1 Tax=Thermoactinomyces mirandus TaxID=2756294 RepID=A0A7W1XQ44_9BACL|nr:diaminopimelate epimerase [Thermoactinomyces mirandus]MBA4601126.1 diaminopimelate epimerase [Thermoactinomyces mirandus]